MMTNSCEKIGSEIGCDGNDYQTVVIGNQTWMAENLDCSETGNFDKALPYDWDPSNSEVYGLLYTWETACNICPDGWHLPTEDEWIELFEYLGGDSIAGGKMKETGTSHWISPNTGATNSSGFTALAGGHFTHAGYGGGLYATGIDYNATFWTSSIATLEHFNENDVLYMTDQTLSSYSVTVGLTRLDAKAFIDRDRRDNMHSVRCVKN